MNDLAATCKIMKKLVHNLAEIHLSSDKYFFPKLFSKLAFSNSDKEMRIKNFARIFMGMYRDILETEGTVLSEIITKQTKFKKAVNDKNWSCLMECISDLNELAEKFNALDERRAKFSAGNLENSETHGEEYALLSDVRGKLIKCRAESRAMCEYINITRGFVQTVLDNAVPGSRARIYSRKGYVANPQPSSVVFNTLF